MTDYTTLAAVKDDLGITETDRDSALARAIRAASREIDRWTGTEFGVTASPSARVFDTWSDGCVQVDRFTDTTGLIVKVGARGVYSTTVASTDYRLLPNNADVRGMAYDTIVVPFQPSHYGDGWPGMEVTAKWGWANVPDDVEEAARLRAIHLFHRREAAHGTAGYADDGVAVQNVFGADPDIKRLLAIYTDMGIA